MDYAERLTVPLRWWAQGTMLVASLWLALVVAVPGVIAWPVTAAALALMVALFVSYGRARVAVDGSTLRAGRAHVPLEHIGGVTALDADGVRRQAGVDAADPTPYWLVSCRRPQALASALEAGRTGPAAG